MYFEWVPLNNAADGETSAGVDEIVPCWLRTDEENVALNRELLRLLWMEPLNSLYPSENNRIVTFPKSSTYNFWEFCCLGASDGKKTRQ